ncbi:MAG TPA: SDR family oxidoreductase [Kofleriaceae bacterium]|nr:SDR family oxidoreductase [Kofleriaceae bacterium]
MTAVVTGASRGLGLGLVRHLAARGDVLAAARDPGGARELAELAAASHGKVRVLACDVADDDSVRRFAAAVGDTPVDLLVNNAGVYGGDEQSVRGVDFEDAVRTFQTNALGPLRVALALLPNLRRARGAKIVSLTSGMGSIADNTSGGFYAYRMSKAALNMAARGLAVDLRKDGIISVVINPGWVQTDMGGAGASIDIDTSVTSMLREIDALTLADTGTFRNWRGGTFAW